MCQLNPHRAFTAAYDDANRYLDLLREQVAGMAVEPTYDWEATLKMVSLARSLSQLLDFEPE